MDRKEKRKLTKIVMAKVADLQAGALERKEKRKATKALMSALNKLRASINLSSDTTEKNVKLKKLIAGGYNSLLPIDFLKILKEIDDEINDIEPLKQPTIAYIEKQLDEAA